MNWKLPEHVSVFGAELDSLYYIILWITGIIFVAVEVVLIYFIIKYRHRPGRKAAYITGNTRAEVVWTVIPLIILLFLGFKSSSVWLDVKHPDRFPTGGLELVVSAKQFEWNVTYPGPDGVLGTADDFVKRNQLHFPVDVPVVVTLEAEDVIHSFFLPELRVKQDAVPGMRIPVWFQATRTGDYVLGCAELCGLGHYRMRGSVTVHTAEAFEQWVADEVAAASMTASN